MNRRLLFIMLMTAPLSCHAGSPTQAEEAGVVSWGRDLDTALAASRTSGRPVLALFQEIPGCAGCKQFGRDVLSNPLLVEAIETQFTPLLIHNNKPGRDAEVLKRFGEPAWNYQVVRFLDPAGKDIIPRRLEQGQTSGAAVSVASGGGALCPAKAGGIRNALLLDGRDGVGTSGRCHHHGGGLHGRERGDPGEL